MAFLAVKINFLLGLRVGELVALKWKDCKEQSHIHVVREEVRNQETNLYHVVEHTKTNRDRYVILVPKANSIPLDCIREMLGHSNLSTTLEYIYNPLTEKETYDLITKAL